MSKEDLTPEEIEQVKREHVELLKRKDEEARKKVQGLKTDHSESDIEDSSDIPLDKSDTEDVEEDASKDSSHDKHIESDRRVSRKKVRKKHSRNLKSFTRDYLSMVFIVLVMIVLVYYAFVLTLQ